MTRAGATGAAARRLAQLQRADQSLETLREQLVDLLHHAAELCAIKVTLHQMNHVLHQHVTLHTHDGRRGRSNKKHDKVIARLFAFARLFFVKLGIVEGHFNGCPLLRQLIQAHAKIIQGIAKIFSPRNRPAHLQHVGSAIKNDARFLFIGTCRPVLQRTRARVGPQGFQGFL